MRSIFGRVALNLRLRKVALPALLLTAVACDPGGPSEPEPASVAVQIVAESGVVPSGPLRLAAVWEAGTESHKSFVTTSDVPVESLNSTQVITVRMPPKSDRPSIISRSQVYVSCGDDSAHFIASVLIPRLVVYEDLDRNGRFEPDLPNLPGADRVWAASRPGDATTLVAFEDLDAALAEEPTEIAECVRENTTLGRYTAFFMASSYSSYVTPTNEPLHMWLSLSPTDYARVVLGCPTAPSSTPSDYSAKVYASRTAIVDATLSADVCAKSPYTCAVSDVKSTLPAMLVPSRYPGFQRSLYCTVSGVLDTLWMSEATLSCAECACTWTEIDTAWVVDSAQPPSSWPCGQSLRYCSVPQATSWDRPNNCLPMSFTRPL